MYRRAKRAFDLIICVATAGVWIPTVIVCYFLILIASGRPVLYISKRRVYLDKSLSIVKFRAMLPNAATIANRDTIAISNQRFLNISSDSPLYTRIGLIFERMFLVELPQLFQVLAGKLSLVGNRPLPENVIKVLRAGFDNAEERFQTLAGMTGPVQLVGRENLSDEDRLRVEIAYCKNSLNSYSMILDFLFLLYTVMIGIRVREHFTVSEVLTLMYRYSTRKKTIEPSDSEEYAKKSLMAGF